ncbi:carbonic anhydrase family protein [Leifsonia sp. F6_8S_P_1B]|uniref:Carbonic anhydrase family protein n=1 Tax=Leifsonia williamsii TaxID=3035919 RepID=A0ABT8K6C0_9MICO|nr:carbonic anhydrase family protein [Leifsonia williamsii]MDN4612998.1 carbonic anhydrase family protein [Leifsonia williamsii]
MSVIRGSVVPLSRSLGRRHPRRRLLAVAPGLVGAAVLVLSGCAGPGTAATATPVPSASDWSYNGATGPAHWDAVAKTCRNTSASHESPIDIVTGTLKSGSATQAVRIDYHPTSFTVENTGHTVEAVPADLTADAIELDGTRYFLQQFHFHATSEHTVDGKHATAELHLVHKSKQGEVVVLAVLLDPGADNPALDELLGAIPTSGKEAELTHAIDAAALLPAGSASAQYEGSLTTPPCTEGVRWNVYLSGVTLSTAQLRALTEAYAGNHRPVQPLHGREVTRVPAA